MTSFADRTSSGGSEISRARAASRLTIRLVFPKSSSGILDGFSPRMMEYFPASGGTPRVLAEADSAQGEGTLRFPLVTPDGKSVVYMSLPRKHPAQIEVRFV